MERTEPTKIRGGWRTAAFVLFPFALSFLWCAFVDQESFGAFVLGALFTVLFGAIVFGVWLVRRLGGKRVKEPLKQQARAPLFLILYAIALPASGAGSEELPRLDEHSAKGLQIQCSPAKTSFVVGEPVNLWCVITNTTDMVKPVAWHPSAGSHFCLAKDEDSWMTGILPQVLPQLDDSVRIRSVAGSPEYVLLLPPHSSLRLLLTYKPERSAKFRGIVVYDPLTHGGGFFGNEGVEKAKRACVFSREFEYGVTDSEKRR